MTEPFVHSNFDRVPDDYYPTIDPRCIYAFLEHFQPAGLCVDICAPTGSGIVNALASAGYDACGMTDAFANEIKAQWIVTNPPYDRPLVDDIIRQQITRLETGQVGGLAVLLRSYFDHAKSRVDMFRDCPYYAGQIKLLFRPWWSDNRDKQPIHNFVWQIWLKEIDKPVVMFAEGEQKPVQEQLRLL